MAGERSARRAASPPVLAAGAALALAVAAHLADFAAWNLRVRLLDSAYEWSLTHLLATAAMAAGAAICAGAVVARRPRRRAWVVAGALLAVLLADNVTRLHEHVPAWPVVYAPLLGALGVALVIVAARTPSAALVNGAIALLFGSLLIHVAGPHVVHALGWSSSGWAYQVKVAFKEGSELAGWVLLVPALARLARARPGRGRAAARGQQRLYAA